MPHPAPHTRQPIKLRVNHLNGRRIEKSIVDALVAAGFIIEEFDGELTDVAGQHPAEYDCQLIDWRDADKLIAEHFQVLAGSEPVVALIDANVDTHIGLYVDSDVDSHVEPNNQQENSQLVAGFSDFVCEQELGLASFMLRMRRLVRRYRDPFTLATTNSPEAQVLQTVVNHSSDWVFIKDLEHRFLAVSEEYANTLDRSLESVIGKNDLDVGFSKDVVLGSEKADWQGFWPQDDYAVAQGEPTVETNPYWRVFTGDTRHRRTIRVPLKNHWGDVYALLVCSEDVTALVKAEQVLRERSEMLEKVTQEKLKAENSRLMAELAVTAKNKFIATASHDLRQPLHALGLYLDVLESKVQSSTQQALITKIKNSCNALSVLFNSLLDLSRLEAGVVDVDSVHFNINSLLTSLREEFEEVAADKSLNIVVDNCDVTIFTDAILLERILRNLIQNAVTYTEQGCVEVRCSVRETVLRIDIIDTGPGIPQYEQNAIFSEYYQLEHDGSRPTIGLGLGLAIVRRLVDLLDIKFDLHTEIGKGSVFSLKVPIGDATSIVEPAALSAKSELSGLTVLVIDDDADILDGMRHVLRTHSCNPIVAQSAAEAIDSLTEKDLVPSMIIADYRLDNGRTGDSAIKLVREEFNTDIPAIIVTGDTSADRLKEATNSGFRLLHKPVQPDELVSVISSVYHADPE